ncbi:MAG TPA: DUF4012 domain-containing protein [Acidothermaceae bacterium]|nr:DUF4012 domain-containing protein [Acidothermaceae bacterium]
MTGDRVDPDGPAEEPDDSDSGVKPRWAEPVVVDERPRWRRISATKWAIAGVVLLVVCVFGWVGFKGWELDRSISRAEVDVSYLRTDLGAGHFNAFAPDAARLQGDATDASSASHDPIWVAAGHIPFVGRNLRAASVVAQSLSRIVNGALVPLSTSHTFTIAASDNAGVSNLLTALGEDSGSIAAAVAAVDKANSDVAGLHTSGLLGFVRRRVVSAQNKLSRASTQVKGLSALSTVAPALLGEDKPRTILLMFQTPAEERGTGGLIGAWGELRTDKGAISLIAFGSLDSLAKVPVPPPGVSPDVPAIYGADIALPQNFNLSASFPDAAQIFSKSWSTGPGLGAVPDAVVSIDPVALGHMLSAIGPVKTSNGTTLNAANASDILQKQEYYTFPGANQAPRIAFLGEVTRAVFARMTKPGYAVGALGRKIAQSAGTGDLEVWSSDPTAEAKWQEMGVGGELGSPTAPDAASSVRFALNSLDGSKLGAYLDTSVTSTNVCNPGPLLTITLRSSAPLDIPWYAGTHLTGLDITTMRLSYSLYIAPGWGVKSVTASGQPSAFSAQMEGGWRLIRGVIDVPRTTTRIIAVQLTSGNGVSEITKIVTEPEASTVATSVQGNVTDGTVCTAQPNG